MDKILKLQTEIGVLSKTETNPFFHSKYLDINGLLAQLLPLLEKYDLTVVQPLSEINGRPAITTHVYNKEGKLVIGSTITLPDLTDPQKMGSAITYYRRYSLQSLFLLQAQDDDGEGAKETPKPNPDFARKNAEKDIAKQDTLTGLMDIEKNIKKSKVLSEKDKEELAFIINEKRADFDPTN